MKSEDQTGGLHSMSRHHDFRRCVAEVNRGQGAPRSPYRPLGPGATTLGAILPPWAMGILQGGDENWA